MQRRNIIISILLFVILNIDVSLGQITKEQKETAMIVLSQTPQQIICSHTQNSIQKLVIDSNGVWIDKDEDENYTARHECSFVQAGDKFIMFGGRESAKKLDVYDFNSNTWSVGGFAPKEFNHFQATTYQGFVWVVGSFKTNNFPREQPADNIWLYYPPNQAWIQGPEIPQNRRRGGAGLVVYNDKFYVLGGNTIGHDGGYVDWFDVYDPYTNTWTELESAPHARDHFHAAIIEQDLYAAGGRLSGGEGGVFAPLVSAVDIYNFPTKQWNSLDVELPTPRAAPGIAVFNNELLVMGGEGEKHGPAYKIVEAYNPKTGEWTRKADMNYARHGTQAILSGRGIYIAAGSPKRGGGKQLNMEVFGKDEPEGEAIVASKLIAQETIKIKRGNTSEIELKNTVGNSGCFISLVELKGKNADAFQLENSLELTLIETGSSSLLTVQHTGVKKGEMAELYITYNGLEKLVVQLISK